MKNVKNKTQQYNNRIKLLQYCIMLAFPMLQFIVFYIIVNANSFVLAFKQYETDGSMTFVGLQNFKQLFYDMKTQVYFSAGLKNTLLAYVFSLIIGMSTGLFFSYYIYKKRFAHTFFKVVLFAPSVISSLVLVTVFRFFADGFIPAFFNKVFESNMLGLFSEKSTIIPTLLVYSVWIGLGTPIMMYVGAMGNISDSVIEAAQIDGVTPLKEFVHIVLPQIFPTITVFISTGIAGIFSNQLNLFSFFAAQASYDNYTIGYLLYLKVYKSTGYMDYPYAAALGLIVTVITAALLIAVRTLLKRINPMEGT